MTQEKLTEEVKVRMGTTEFTDLSRLAARENRSLAEYIRHVMRTHTYGAKRTVSPEGDDA